MIKKAIILLIIVIVVGFIVAFFLLGRSGIDEFSIKSNDELAELIIPKATLPDDVSVDDISVTRILDNEFEGESWIVYELEPDGLEFAGEIMLQVQLDSDNDTVPIVFISTSTGIDVVNNTQSEVDLETKKQNVSIPLTHLCRIYLNSGHGTYKITASAQDTPVGEHVLTTASFTLYKDKLIFPLSLINRSARAYAVWEFEEPRVQIKGFWRNWGDHNLSPDGEFGGKPSLTDVSVGQTVTFQDDKFTCTRSGFAELWYKVDITTRMKQIFYRSEEDYLAGEGEVSKPLTDYVHSSYVSISFNCKPEVVEEDPKTDPGVEPKVELSYNFTYDSQGYILNTKIFVDIEAYPGSNGTVTLSGPDMLPITQTVIMDQSGQTRLTFIVYHFGEYTALVKIDGWTIEKKILH